jgi:hypothetical protein
MSRHVTHRGIPVDMESLRRDNGNTTAVGNMKVNARGDRLGPNGEIVKSIEEISRIHHRGTTTVTTGSLKGDQPVAEPLVEEIPVQRKKPKETETPDGDIIVGDE